MQEIIRVVFGSKLYGTDTPDSDTDYKGIYIPSKEQLFLSKFPPSIQINTKPSDDAKNTKDDVEVELYSLHYFMDLAYQGQTVALDMLHAPESSWVTKDIPYMYLDIWLNLVDIREQFYTKNLNAFVDYARNQATKYGVKGSRLNDVRKVLAFLDKLPKYNRIQDVWDELPKGEHLEKLKDQDERDMYSVCGRKVHSTAAIGYTYNMLKKIEVDYGNRAKMAADNLNIDWKAISHAFRAAYEVKQILTEGTITFPLKEVEFIKNIKLGKVDYMTVAAPKLDALITEVEELSKTSDLPMEVDREMCNNFIISTINTLLKYYW